MSELFLAVDGGQSGTVAVLATADGTIVGVGRGGPIRHHEEPDAERFVREGVTVAIAQAMRGTTEGSPIAVCCLAVTGSARMAENAARAYVTAHQYLALESDTFAALASGTGGAGGIGLIAGTGTVALARSRGGKQIIRGGWGWLLGDEGGGFWIAMESLKAAVRDADGTGRSTALTTTLPRLLGEKDMRTVYNLVTGTRLDRTAIAGLTTTVVSIAEAGDTVAAGILNRAATHLTDLLVATSAAAPFLKADEKIVVACGGVFQPDGWVTKRVARQIIERAPEFRMIVPRVAPVVGALYLALAERGITVDDHFQDRVARQGRFFPGLGSKAAATSAD
jgi:glucosamine kinase